MREAAVAVHSCCPVSGTTTRSRRIESVAAGSQLREHGRPSVERHERHEVRSLPGLVHHSEHVGASADARH